MKTNWNCQWKLCLPFITLAIMWVQTGNSLPIELPQSTTASSVPESNILRTPIPVMVPVSSTVISVVKEPSAARQSSSNNYYFTRRFRFFDKSSKPDEPIRLITKSSRLKALMEAAKASQV